MVNTKTKDIKVIVPDKIGMYDLLGYRDELLKIIESSFKSRILARGNEITISGQSNEARLVKMIFKELLEILAAGERLTPQSVNQTISLVKSQDETLSPKEIFSDNILKRSFIL